MNQNEMTNTKKTVNKKPAEESNESKQESKMNSESNSNEKTDDDEVTSLAESEKQEGQKSQCPGKRKLEKMITEASATGKDKSSSSSKSVSKKAKKSPTVATSPDSAGGESKSSTKRRKASKSTRPSNQPSIGSFFAKTKSTSKKNDESSTKKNDESSTKKNNTSSLSTLELKSTLKVATKDTSKVDAKMSEKKSVLDSRDKVKSSSSISSSKVATKSTKSVNKKPNKSNKNAPKKTINIIPQDEDILAIVLGTHKDIDDDDTKKNSTPATYKRTSRRPIHLPELITSDAQFRNVKYAQGRMIPSDVDGMNSNKKGKSRKSSMISKRAKKDPNMPKLPKNAYIIFSLEVRPTVAKSNPGLHGSEAAKELGRLYRELTPEQRKKYDDLAEEEKTRYKREKEDYNKRKGKDNEENVDDDQKLAAKDDDAKLSGVDSNTNNNNTENSLTPSTDVETKMISYIQEKIEAPEEGKVKDTNNDQSSGDLEKEEILEEEKETDISKNGEEDSGLDLDRNDSDSDTAESNNANQRPRQSSNKGKDNSEETAKESSDAADDGNGEENDCDNMNDQKEEGREEDCDITLGSCDDDLRCDENGNNGGALDEEDEEDVQPDLDGVKFDFNRDELDTFEDAGTATQNDESLGVLELEEPGDCDDVVKAEDLFSDEDDDDTVKFPTLILNGKYSENSEIIPAVVNVLQPRKKVKAVEAVHTLQPRKKVKVNQLTPRKKVTVNELQPKVTINELTPRKKSKANSPVTTPDRRSEECAPSPQSSKILTPPARIASTIEDEVEVVEKPNFVINELRPRKKSPMSGTTSNTINIASAPTPIKPPTKLKSPKKIQNPIQVSDEDRNNLEKYRNMRSRYADRAQELVDRAMQGSIEEEDFELAQESLSDESDNEGINLITEFNDSWISQLAMIVQGSMLPLHELAKLSARKISSSLDNDSKVAVDTVSAKIKLLAARTRYLSSIPNQNGDNNTPAAEKVDIFTDSNKTNMWRWELVSMDLLPDDKIACVKKARAARKKLKYHQKAIIKLIHSLDDFELAVNKGKSEADKQKRVAKISADEEKVLKYERDEEKARIQRETKVLKEKEKKQKQLEKEAEKGRKKEELQKKQEAKKKQKAEKSKKQRARMMSFFKSNSLKPNEFSDQPSAKSESSNSIQESQNGQLDSAAFWKMIDSGTPQKGPFSKLSRKTNISRRRKISRVNVRVFATVLPDNPFEQQPYDEERTISVRNRKKFLSFHEDYRPPYHGTWSKPSSTKVTGRKPFGQDTSYLNYEIDSEEEWEEGDDEQGDDCSVEGNDDDELEGEVQDTTKYDYQDGWIAEDDDLALEDDDDETKEMRKKKAAVMGGSSEIQNQSKPVSVCIIAPIMGGLPQFEQELECPQSISYYIQGIEVDEAQKVLSMHQGGLLCPGEICLDPFPPMKQTEKKSSESGRKEESSAKKPSSEMGKEDMKIFARFVHKCNLKSKELIIEEFRLKYRGIISSRAQLHRKLDLIASKRRLKNGGGVLWEVKKRILESLDLKELMKEDPREEEECIEKVTKPSETKTAVSKEFSPALVSPSTDKTISKKRKEPGVSKASANLLASFLKRKKI